MQKNSDEFDFTMKALHWLTAALIFIAFAIGMMLEGIPRGAGRSWWTAQHELAGVLVIGFVAIRLIWRLNRGAPGQLAELPAWQRHAASLTQWALYLLMLASAIVGVFLSWARGRTVGLPGLFDLPPLVAQDRALGGRLEGLHGLISYALLVLVALHVAAALYHHFVLHDGVLRRMLRRRAAT
jgi:cytochrome b561